MCRINWDPVMTAGKGDIQAGLTEYTKQAQALGEMDYAEFLATKEKVTIKTKVRDCFLNRSRAHACQFARDTCSVCLRHQCPGVSIQEFSRN